jgi:hypothetical protein
MTLVSGPGNFFRSKGRFRISFSTDGHTTYVRLIYCVVIRLISFIFLSVLVFGTKADVYGLA